jgi:hypothetical protein
VQQAQKQIGNGENYTSAARNNALTEALQAHLKADMPVEDAMRASARALR